MPQPDLIGTLPERPPEVGELVQVRSRRWLVEEVTPSEIPGASAVVTLACADDDAQGQALRVRDRPSHSGGGGLGAPRRTGLRRRAPVRGVPAHAALALRDRHRRESLPGTFPSGHPDRRLPDGAAPQGVAAPPSVLEQWKGELEDRFGPVFEILPSIEGSHDARRGSTFGERKRSLHGRSRA